MNQLKWLLAAILLVASGLNAQKLLTLEDVVSGGLNYRQLMPARPSVSFDINGKGLLVSRGSKLMKQNIKDSNAVEVLNLVSINAQLEKMGLSSISSLKIFTQYGRDYWFNSRNVLIRVQERTNTVLDTIKLPVAASGIDFMPGPMAIAYTLDNNLWVRIDHKTSVCIGKSEKAGIKYGQAVHRNEFGISKGTFWNGDASKLAFYKLDESMVADFPIVDYLPRIAEVKPVKYPMAGMTTHKVEVGVYDVVTGTVSYLNMGDVTDRYFTNICWVPNGQSLLIAELNRAQTDMQMKHYDAVTGQLKSILFTENNSKWVEPENPPSFVPFMDNCFIWQSKRDGFNHLYLYNMDGALIKQLTAGQWDVTGILGYNASEKSVIIESTLPSPLERHIYKVSLQSGEMVRLTTDQGYHQSVCNKAGYLILDYYTASTNPGVTQIINTKGMKVREVARAVNPLAGYFTPQINLVEIKAADTITPLYGRIVLPKDFDASKKYPVVVYVYGGPHNQLVANKWLYSAQLWQVYMAQKGYISFTMDNRGTSNRGRDFEQVIHRRLGINELNDQMKGVAWLKSLPYVDTTRMGVHGWSFGGHMTTAMMLRHNDVFKVGVAGGPVMDWKYYEVMYGERYMDTPQENEEGFKSTSLISQADQLKGRLLIIHGGIDPVVVLQHSMLFIESCIQNGKQVDSFIYPTHEHNVMGHDRVHLMEKVTRYFDDNL